MWWNAVALQHPHTKKKGGGGEITLPFPVQKLINQLKNDYVLSYLDQVTSVEELRSSRLQSSEFSFSIFLSESLRGSEWHLHFFQQAVLSWASFTCIKNHI